MPQHTRYRLDIHTVLQGQRCEGVVQVMEPDVGQASLLEQHLQLAVGRFRIYRQLRAGGVREDPLTDGPLLSLSQELHDALGQDDGARSFAGLGVPQSEHAHLFAVEGAAHLQRAFFIVEIFPHQATDFTPPQAGHELSVEELVPDVILADGLHEGVQLLLVQDALGLVVWSGGSRSLGGILRDDVCLHCIFHGTVEHGMDVVDGGVGEFISIIEILMDTAFLFQAAVHPLYVLTGDEGHLLVAQLWFDVTVSELTV